MPNLQLAKNLRALREAHHFSQTEVAALLNISRQAYTNYENCKRSPDLSLLIHLSRFYEITLDTLILNDLGSLRDSRELPKHSAVNIRTSDTIYLTNKEAEMIFAYRTLSSEKKKQLREILK